MIMELCSGYLSGGPASGGELGPKPQQIRKQRQQQQQQQAHFETLHTSTHHIAPSSNPFRLTQLPRFPQLPPFMAQLAQDVVVKEEDASMMGSLDSHYLEQYGGEHLPSLHDVPRLLATEGH